MLGLYHIFLLYIDSSCNICLNSDLMMNFIIDNCFFWLDEKHIHTYLVRIMTTSLLIQKTQLKDLSSSMPIDPKKYIYNVLECDCTMLKAQAGAIKYVNGWKGPGCDFVILPSHQKLRGWFIIMVGVTVANF